MRFALTLLATALLLSCVEGYDGRACDRECDREFDACFLGLYALSQQQQSSPERSFAAFLGCESAKYVCKGSCGTSNPRQ